MLREFRVCRNEAGEGNGGGGALTGDGGGGVVDAGAGSGTEAPAVTFPENWKEGIPEEFRGDPALGVIPDVPTLVKNYIHAQKSLGKKGVPLPNQHSTAEERQAFFQQLGLPQSLDTYDVNLPEDMSFNDGFLSAFKEQAFQANILPEQANALLTWYNKANAEALEAAMTEEKLNQQAELQALKQEWGQEYNQKLQLAKAVLNKTGLNEVNTWLEQTGLDNSSMMIKLLAAIGGIMKEDGVVDLGNNVGPSNAELTSRIQEIEGNRSGALYDRKHPNHQAAVEERNRLYQQLYPTEA